ncbi:MAG: thioredoxin [Alphaproteobacteria bacterium]|nr:thioredoxin [Alphaproteobacteria bacterium]
MIGRFLGGLVLWLATLSGAAWAETRIGGNGLHEQDWFLQSFLDLREDLAEARAAGKRLAVVFEQRGCIYCTQMHEKHLEKAAIRDYLKANFAVLQLDLYGSRQVTDFDGKEIEERALARRLGVTSTPTVVFFHDQVASGQGWREAEAARMRGLLKPFEFLAMFRYVRQRAYATAEFPAWLKAEIAQARASGVDIEAF